MNVAIHIDDDNVSRKNAHRVWKMTQRIGMNSKEIAVGGSQMIKDNADGEVSLKRANFARGTRRRGVCWSLPIF